MEKGKLIRLNDNWVSVAIDNLDSFNDVGYLDFAFLDQVLPHCTKEQLAHIESCTKEVDLTPITDKLWRNFFERDFGGRAVEEITDKIKIEVKLEELYEAKSMSLEKDEKEVGERVKKLYEKEEAQKQSRKVKLVDKAPPSKMRTHGVNNKGRKGNKMMKKLKRQFENSLEKKNLDYVKMRTAAANALSDPIKKQPRTTSIML